VPGVALPTFIEIAIDRISKIQGRSYHDIPRTPPCVVISRKLAVMANSHKLLAALNTSLDENHEVMKLAERTLLPPRLHLFECHIIRTSIVHFEPLIVRNEEESSGGEVDNVDNVTLAAKSVRSGIVLNVKSA
jgi:hypothetical protein